MDMVCIDTYFEEIEVVCGAKFQTYGFQSLCYRGSEHVPPVFHWADQVVYEEGLVVWSFNVLRFPLHYFLVYREVPPMQACGEKVDYSKCLELIKSRQSAQ